MKRLRAMISNAPPRDWTDIRWAEVRGGRCGAVDRGAAAGGDRAAWPAFAARHRRHDRARPIWRGCASFCRQIFPATFLPVQPVGHFHRAYRFSGHADAADRGRAEGLDGARRQRRTRRRQEARDGDQPWRQQRRDDAGRAGSARAARHACGHDKLVALRRAGRFVFRRGIAPRHSWRRGRNLDHAGALPRACAHRRDRRFPPPAIAMEQEFRWLSAQRPAPFAWQAQDLHPSGAVGDATQASAEKGERCSITAPARSANCLKTSITST